ncbi:hypothetical protein ACNKU7_13870, partial [Microbulbifer sp. SA54]|uniref:hypothetical protein n=1 Tax=Microbulbifer sp. SA54 TaxID=3401577 RepID=UPI003AAB7830
SGDLDKGAHYIELLSLGKLFFDFLSQGKPFENQQPFLPLALSLQQRGRELYGPHYDGASTFMTKL